MTPPLGPNLTRRSVLAGAAAATLVRPAAADTRPILNDASLLNPTPVAKHVRPRSGPAEPLIELLRTELKAAATDKRPVAVGVARHSMGGQSLPRDGVAVTLPGGPIELDSKARTYRTVAGTRWWDVIKALDPQGFSPAVMQSNSDFGLGSTFSVNAHGWPVPYGPFGSTVRSLRLLMANGELVTCSRQENAELFGLAMGGYGLFGIIVDLEVDMVANALMAPTFQTMSANRFSAAFIKAVQDPKVKMAYGRLSVSRQDLFDEALLVSYREAASQPAKLPAATQSGSLTGLSRELYRAQTGSELFKWVRWTAETRIAPNVASAVATRNSLMAEPVVNLAGRDGRRTDILHEYFIPPDKLGEFIAACRALIPPAKAEFLNVTLRYVGADPDAVLAFAPAPRIAAVMSFSQEISPAGEVDMIQLTEELIERVVGFGGSFYLPYRLHARRDQLRTAYPRAEQFVAAKRRHDPNTVFRNRMWDTYLA
jgi:FAD/FMN-containing dehydrogenase